MTTGTLLYLNGIFPPLRPGNIETSDGVMLRYEDRGRGLPIVFVHGWAATSRFWEGQVSRLSPYFRTITPDLRGHGDSDRESGLDYSTGRLVRDILELEEFLGIGKPLFVGHSLGGIISASCAADAGASGLLLTGVSRIIDVPATRLKILMKMRWLAERLVTPRMFAPGVEPELLELVRGESAKSPAGVLVEVMEGTAGSELPSLDKKIPLLVVAGELDSLVPVETQRSMALEFGGMFATVRGAGHNLMLERPAEFAGIIQDFAEGL